MNHLHVTSLQLGRFGRTGAWLALALALLSACSVTRHVPQDQNVLSRVRIEVDGKPSTDNTYRLALSQTAYHRTFGFLPVSTWIWHNDTVRAIHRFRAKLGTEPPVYDEALTARSERALRRTLLNQGYLSAQVSHTERIRRRKVQLTYHIDRGTPHSIRHLTCQVQDSLIRPYVTDPQYGPSTLQVGQTLDRTQLEAERVRLTNLLRNEGYYSFNKDNISFVADTLAGSKDVDLTMVVDGQHQRYTIASVRFVPNYDLVTGGTSGSGDYLRPSVLAENCYIQPGAIYSEEAVRKTYRALSRLYILKYVNIRMEPADSVGSLDCTICLSRQSPHSVQFELDGTNTSGDLGFATTLTYRHRNLFRGSEAFTVTAKGGYESLTGDVSGLVNDNYTNYSLEARIDFPRFLFPFMAAETRRQISATTGVSFGYSYQSIPEYTRIITNAGLTYKWHSTGRNWYHNLDVLDLGYVYLPKRSERFLQIIQNAGPISYSSYTSHLITSSSYNFYAGTKLGSTTGSSAYSSGDVWSLHLNPEIGGNFLQSIARAARFERQDGRYVVFDLPYEQYFRFDADWAYSRYLTDRSRLAFHLAGGVAVPYGNSSVMPFEKRYYAGGANSVRGWNVRSLGPGRYKSAGSRVDYFNQCGDIRLDASVELRSRLFWKFEFASFIDAGNVWTLEDYASQAGGAISADFYREIAASWGVGLRFVTDFVILRLDLGVKAYDPTRGSGRDAWVITDPLNGSNRTVHFAVGYPF